MRENTVRPQAHPHVPGSGPSPSERQTWLVLLCSAVAVTGVVLVSIPLISAIDATAILTVSGVIAVVLVVLSVVARLRRSPTRHSPENALGVAEDVDQDTPEAVADEAPEKVAEGSEKVADEAPEQLTKRVLRLQVRTLESALEELQQLRLDDARCADERQSEDNPAVSRERALVTVRALRDTLADQPGFAAVDRIEAALTRIGVEVSFERPTLTSMPVAVPFVTFGNPAQVVVAERTPVTEAVTEAVAGAVMLKAPIEEVAAEESHLAVALIEEAVLAVTPVAVAPVAVALVAPVVLPVPVAVVEAPIEESLPVSFAEPEPEPVPVSSVQPDPVPAPDDESEAAPVPDVPAPVATVVLPVPAPPPVAVEPRSRRRRLRRSVAA
ncbi:MAG: hypothetical protein H0V42_09600 [Nocardioidaceae bacterium]|nr:hypothetical protein [Nocardioidaceae bacterium]